jgi:hypothetical protein
MLMKVMHRFTSVVRTDLSSQSIKLQYPIQISNLNTRSPWAGVGNGRILVLIGSLFLSGLRLRYLKHRAGWGADLIPGG